MTRRALFKILGGASAVAALAACKNNNATADAPAVDTPAGDEKVVIADNHAHAPHSLTVTLEDVMAGADKTYDIQGMANHNHQVTITAAQFATLLACTSSIMDTTTIAVCHSHVITVSCP